MARGWPHNDACSMCDQELETGQHLGLHCPFAREVWAQFQNSNPDAVMKITGAATISDWWEEVRRAKKDTQRRKDNPFIVYTIWHIWKERGCRIFRSESMTAPAVASLIRSDLELLESTRVGHGEFLPVS
jgi:hypothetical protein